ncbi:MAG: Methyltransferase type 11 [Magnetococcales bacterium]|nr:Methyltransferase type 11 [Magnetococcales bacterium]HIJ83679.1 class I SAM-dependent methyltransferase [Magnetococcales bacterium]
MTDSIQQQTTFFYDAEAQSYDRIRYSSTQGGRIDRFHKMILTAALARQVVKPSPVLELGCGTGRLLCFMASHCDGLIGVDISQGMLDVAKKKLIQSHLPHVGILRGNGQALPFPDECFAMVYSILVINLIPDFYRVFLEVRRVLQHNGVFLFSVPNLSGLYYPAGAIVNRRQKSFGQNRKGSRYGHWFFNKEVRLALLQAGLQVDHVWGQPPWTPFVNRVRPLPATSVGRFFSKSLYYLTSPKPT